MKYKNIVIIIAVVLIVFAPAAMSQQMQLPYYCGFEDPVENARWELNYNPNLKPGRLKNLWHIGTAVAAEGDSSLYVSSDGGLTASYTNSDNTILAYRVFDLPPGTYDLAFDWMAYADNTSAIHVALIDSTVDRVLSLTSPDLPPVIIDNELTMSDGKSLNGVSVWKHAMTQFTITETGKKYKLVFAWNNNTAAFINPGGCIDNVELAKASCVKPSNLKTDKKGSNVTVSWQGSADSYEFGYKRFGDNVWTTSPVTGASQKVVYGLANGVYDFKVRSICGVDTSIWVLFDKVLIYEALCIDYINLDSAECKYGTVKDLNEGKGTVGKVDNGYDDITSRHTIHFLPGERDPRTNNLLKTIPDGEVASVRIGTWDNAHAEQITYRYTVDSVTARVMMLKYAIVFDTPNHDKKDQPHFLLQIFDDETGEQIMADCAEADFYAKLNEDGWTTLKYGGRDIVWKDWTTLGINLGPLHGRKIRIKIAVFGCTFSAHYAYAYFTLGCSKGNIEGMSCGVTPTQFVVTEGFDYKWYEVRNPSKVLDCDSNVFIPEPGDTLSYYVDLMYKENHDCKFTLVAHMVPRVPRARATYVWNPRNCQNIVEFVDSSGVYALPPDKPERLEPDKIETYLWDFGEYGTSQERNPQLPVPNEGDTFMVSLQTGYNNCYDNIEFEVSVPAIPGSIDEPFESVETVMVCVKDLNAIDSIPDKIDTLSTKYGCDSIVAIHYEYITAVDTLLQAEICSDSVYHFAGKDLTESGVYTDTLQTDLGCDSIVTLELTVNEELIISDIQKVEFCSDDSIFVIPLDVQYGSVDSVALQFGQSALENGFDNMNYRFEDNQIVIIVPDSLRSDIYTIDVVAYNYKCGAVELPIQLRALYPSSIVRQKWGDVLAVLNATNNGGGYEFTSFQWYVDDVAIAEATRSYLYTDGGILDESSRYSVMLTRTDGVVLPTCYIVPDAFSDKASYPSVVSPAHVGQQLSIQPQHESCSVSVYNMSGVLVSEQELGYGETFAAPGSAGAYIVIIVTSQNTYSQKLLVYNL